MVDPTGKKKWIQIMRIFQTKKRLTNQKVVPRKTSRTTRPECPEMRFSRVCPLPCHTASILCGNGRRVGCRVGPTSPGYRHAYTAYGKTDTYLKQRMHTTTTTTKCSSVQHCNIQHATWNMQIRREGYNRLEKFKLNGRKSGLETKLVGSSLVGHWRRRLQLAKVRCKIQ